MITSVFEEVLIEDVALQTEDNDTITTDEVDMQGFEGVAFVVTAQEGQTLAGWSIKAQQDTVTGMGSAADLEGTAVAFSSAAASRVTRVLDIKQPQERFVRAVITVPNLNAETIVSCLAIKYGAAVKPVGNSGELHQAPDEGTA